MPEPFDIKKLLTSPLTGLYWTKVVAIGLGIFTILVVGYTFWRAYGKKLFPQQHRTRITLLIIIIISGRPLVVRGCL